MLYTILSFRYENASGRESMLEMLISIITCFPEVKSAENFPTGLTLIESNGWPSSGFLNVLECVYKSIQILFKNL